VWPGGYPLFYLDDEDGSADTVCPDCVNKDDWYKKHIVAVDVNWEDPAMFCANCNKRIESAYAEDEVGKVEGAKVKAGLYKENDTLLRDGKPFAHVYNVAPGWVALKLENGEVEKWLPGDLAEDIESGVITVEPYKPAGEVKAATKSGSGNCEDCGKEKATVTVEGAHLCASCGEKEKKLLQEIGIVKGSVKVKADGEAFQEVTGKEPIKVVDLVTGGESFHMEKKDAYKMAWIIQNKLGHNYRIEFRDDQSSVTSKLKARQSVKAESATVTMFDSVVSQESAEAGDIDHKLSDGPEDAEEVTFDSSDIDPDDPDRNSLPKVVAEFLEKKGATQASGSAFYPCLWYETEPSENFQTGDTTTTSFHLNDMSTEDQAEVWNLMGLGPKTGSSAVDKKLKAEKEEVIPHTREDGVDVCILCGKPAMPNDQYCGGKECLAEKVKGAQHPPKCDQCDSAYINGVYCHEHGCPNRNKYYDFETEEWVREQDEDMDFEASKKIVAKQGPLNSAFYDIGLYDKASGAGPLAVGSSMPDEGQKEYYIHEKTAPGTPFKKVAGPFTSYREAHKEGTKLHEKKKASALASETNVDASKVKAGVPTKPQPGPAPTGQAWAWSDEKQDWYLQALSVAPGAQPASPSASPNMNPPGVSY
jgi:hypothetical protein